MLINLPDSQKLLYGIKDQMRSLPRLNLPANIDTFIWSYYTFLKIQALC